MDEYIKSPGDDQAFAALGNLICVTANVTCRLCGLTTSYPAGEHAHAAVEFAQHLADEHPHELRFVTE